MGSRGWAKGNHQELPLKNSVFQGPQICFACYRGLLKNELSEFFRRSYRRQILARARKVLGFDIQQKRVDLVNQGHSYIADVSNESLSTALANGVLEATTNKSRLKEVDVISICVPTLLTKTKEPDLSYVIHESEEISKHLRAG